MVLESLINTLTAEKKPSRVFFLGVLYYSVAVLLSLWIFRKYSSLISIFLTVVAAVPLMFNTLKYEEQQDFEIEGEKKVLKQHSKALMFFMMLFFGITIAVAAWYILLPGHVVQDVFSVQAETINEINSYVTGKVVYDIKTFSMIFFNNIKVLTFSTLFSFIYGAGAIFILTWNASVIGVAMGNVIRNGMAEIANRIGFEKITGYFHVFSFAIMRYSIHGIPEILAYFIGALAGGIISVAVINHDFNTKRFERIILDTSDLLVIAILMLLVAAALEVWITPLVA